MGAILYYTIAIFLAFYLGTIVISAFNDGPKSIILVVGAAISILGKDHTFFLVVGTIAIGISMILAFKEAIHGRR